MRGAYSVVYAPRILELMKAEIYGREIAPVKKITGAIFFFCYLFRLNGGGCRCLASDYRDVWWKDVISLALRGAR